MIPLALITGFLGSGKTTLLQQLARRHRERKLVWLVNEFSARDMDTARLSGLADDVVSVVGGSIFCRCLVTEFIRQLRDLPERFGTPHAPVEGVVVEASGMANPVVAGKMLGEARLDRIYTLTTVVAVVDPGSFLKLQHTLPAVRAQIEAATFVLINKIDLHPPERIAQTEEAVRAINPAAPVLRTCQAEADVDLFGARCDLGWRGELAPCKDPHFATLEVTLTTDLDLDRLRQAVASAGDDVFRVKGFARVDGRPLQVDYSASGWQIVEAAGDQPGALVAIVRGSCSDAVRRRILDVGRGGG